MSKKYRNAERTYKMVGYAIAAVIVIAGLFAIVYVVCEAI